MSAVLAFENNPLADIRDAVSETCMRLELGAVQTSACVHEAWRIYREDRRSPAWAVKAGVEMAKRIQHNARIRHLHGKYAPTRPTSPEAA